MVLNQLSGLKCEGVSQARIAIATWIFSFLISVSVSLPCNVIITSLVLSLLIKPILLMSLFNLFEIAS